MIDKPSPTDVATLRQDYDNLRRRQEALAKKMPAAFAAAVRRAYNDRKPIPPKTKLFDKPSLITRRIAKGDHSEAAWTKLKNETVRLLRAQGGKARERTPDNRGDFVETNIALVDNRWIGETATTGKRSVTQLARRFFEALQAAAHNSKLTHINGYPSCLNTDR